MPKPLTLADIATIRAAHAAKSSDWPAVLYRDNGVERLLDAAEQGVRLRTAIQDFLDGNYPHAERNAKCKHGIRSYESCEACIEEYFAAALSATEEH